MFDEENLVLPPGRRPLKGYQPRVPCEVRFEYTLDGGETWMGRHEFLQAMKVITTPVDIDRGE